MALAGTGAVLAAARVAAENAVRATWLAKGRVLTPAEQAQMNLEMKIADSNAIIAHIIANATVAVASVSGVTTGAGISGPGAGVIT